MITRDFQRTIWTPNGRQNVGWGRLDSTRTPQSGASRAVANNFLDSLEETTSEVLPIRTMPWNRAQPSVDRLRDFDVPRL